MIKSLLLGASALMTMTACNQMTVDPNRPDNYTVEVAVGDLIYTDKYKIRDVYFGLCANVGGKKEKTLVLELSFKGDHRASTSGGDQIGYRIIHNYDEHYDALIILKSINERINDCDATYEIRYIKRKVSYNSDLRSY